MPVPALPLTPAQLILRQKHRNATETTRKGKEHTEPLPCCSLAIKPVGLHSRGKTNLSLDTFSSVVSVWAPGNTLEGQNDKTQERRVTNPAITTSLHEDTALSEEQLNSSSWGKQTLHAQNLLFQGQQDPQIPQILAPPVLHTKLSKEQLQRAQRSFTSGNKLGFPCFSEGYMCYMGFKGSEQGLELLKMSITVSELFNELLRVLPPRTSPWSSTPRLSFAHLPPPPHCQPHFSSPKPPFLCSAP